LRPKVSILSAVSEKNECSEQVRNRVIDAREIQTQRSGQANALLSNKGLKRFCHIESDTLRLLEHATKQLYLSPRACHRILKVSRTIADLDHAQDIKSEHIAEAIAFRRLNTATALM
jgi:magnesium chelatase family protein